MSTRAERREAARTIVKLAPESDADALASSLKREEKLKEYVRSYKTQLERMVMGLNMANRAIIKSDLAAAAKFIRLLFASDLKEAREVVANREQALDIAVAALEKLGTNAVAAAALSEIALLSPEVASTGVQS